MGKNLSVPLTALVIALITIAVYIPAIRGTFIWDDAMYITGNPLVHSTDGLHKFWLTTEALDYYPLTWTLWWSEWRAWSQNPLGYHIISLSLHIANAFLLWYVLEQLGIPAAWFAALLFAIHPVNVATVAWISEQKNTLSMLFCLLSIAFYLHFDGVGRPQWYGLSLLSFLLALLSKSAVVMLPVVLLACIWWRHRELRIKQWWHTAPFFIFSLVFGFITVWFQYHNVLRGHPARSDGFMSRLFTAARAVWFYLWKIILPINLSAIYPRWSTNSTSLAAAIPLILLAACFAVFFWKRNSWSRPLLFASVCFVAMLFPVLGFFDQNFYHYSLVADHWQYYSIGGVIAAFVSIGVYMSRSRRWATGAVLVLVLGSLTRTRAHVYANSRTLWQDAVTKNPNAWSAHNNLGNELLQAGDLAGARQEYEEALRIEPFLAEPHNNLGTIFIRTGNLQAAIQEYARALEIKIDYPEAQSNLGAALLEAGDVADALPHLAAAVQLNPNYAEARYNLAVSLASKGRIDEAISEINAALALQPNREEFRQELKELESKGH